MTEKEILDNLISSYPKLKVGCPSSYALFSNDFKRVITQYGSACHYNMRNLGAKLYDQLVTAVPRSDEDSISYINWLIEHSFKSFKDRISLSRHNDEWYLRCFNLDTWPANVLMNFCIASRLPIETPKYIDRWTTMCKAGVDKMLAFIVATRIEAWIKCHQYEWSTRNPEYKLPAKDSDPWTWVLPMLDGTDNHFWFDGVANWHGLISGEMNITAFSPNFKDNPSKSTPTNIIWGKMSPELGQTLVGKTTKELAEIFGLIGNKPNQFIYEKHDYDFDLFDDDDDDFDDDDDDDDFDDDEFFEDLGDDDEEELIH